MKREKKALETAVHGVFLLLGLVTVGCVLLITCYLVVSGIPAIREIGLRDFLLAKTWTPTAAEPSYGILPFILTSVYGTAGAILLGVPIGFMTAVYLAKLAPQRIKHIMQSAVSLLAGIPSVVYGLVGMMVLVRMTMENNFCLTGAQLEAAITPRTRLLVLCTPNNPTGSVYSHEALVEIVRVLEKHPEISVISDEIYEHILYTGHHESLGQFASLKDRVVIINGVSKSHAMTGYRIGWLACHDKGFISAVKRLQGQQCTCATTIAQKAAEAAYTGDRACVETMRQAFERRRDLIVRLAREIEGLKVLEPQGAFYLFPDVSSFFGKSHNGFTVYNANEVVEYLLNEAHVACVSGSAFGEDNCIRLSYATSEDLIVEAMRRIMEALGKLK